MKKSWKSKVAELRATRKAEGLCIYCAAPPLVREDGTRASSCAACQKRDRDRKREEYGKRVKPQTSSSGGSCRGLAELLWEDDLELLEKISPIEELVLLGQNPEDR